MFEHGQFLLFLAVVLLGAALFLQEWVVIENKKANTCTKLGFRATSVCTGSLCDACVAPVVKAASGPDDSVCVFPAGSPEQLTCLARQEHELFLLAGAGCIVAATVLAVGMRVGALAALLAAIGSGLLMYAILSSTTGALTPPGKTPLLVGSGCTDDYCASTGVSTGLTLLGALLSAAAVVPVSDGAGYDY